MGDGRTYEISRPVATILFISVLAVLCLDGALLLQNVRLKKRIGAPLALLPKVGTRIDGLDGLGPAGSRVQLTFSARQNEQTLLFVFSPTCGVCKLNWPIWRSVAQSARAKSYRLVYANIGTPLSLDFLERNGIQGETVFAELDPRYISELNLRLTPLTIAIARSGEVTHVWTGFLDDHQLSDLSNVLGLGSS